MDNLAAHQRARLIELEARWRELVAEVERLEEIDTLERGPLQAVEQKMARLKMDARALGLDLEGLRRKRFDLLRTVARWKRLSKESEQLQEVVDYGEANQRERAQEQLTMVVAELGRLFEEATMNGWNLEDFIHEDPTMLDVFEAHPEDIV